jgi:hypothetical protein
MQFVEGILQYVMSAWRNNNTHALYSTLFHVFIMHCSFIDQVEQCAINILKNVFAWFGRRHSPICYKRMKNNSTHALYHTLIQILVFHVFITHCSFIDQAEHGAAVRLTKGERLGCVATRRRRLDDIMSFRRSRTRRGKHDSVFLFECYKRMKKQQHSCIVQYINTDTSISCTVQCIARLLTKWSNAL